MLIVPEALIAGLVTPKTLSARWRPPSPRWRGAMPTNFPVVREALGEGRQYGFKSGLDRAGGQLGVKAGGYFPGNAAKGHDQPPVQVFLFDPDTGRPVAMVGGNLLTALRTAAASGDFHRPAGTSRGAGPGHRRRGASGRVPAARGGAGAALRAGDRLEPAPRDAAEAGRGRRRTGPAVRGGRPAPDARGGCDHHHHLVARRKPDGRACRSRHASGLHGHRHPGQAGGRAGAGRRRPVFTDEVAQSSPSARRSMPSRPGWLERSASCPWAMCWPGWPRGGSRPTRSRSSTAPAWACRTLPWRRGRDPRARAGTWDRRRGLRRFLQRNRDGAFEGSGPEFSKTPAAPQL
jgi:hypothetical protein